MSVVIDFHTHIFPSSLENYAEKYIPQTGMTAIDRTRDSLRSLMRPFANSVHKAKPLVRFLPAGARSQANLLSGIASIPGLFVESSGKDLEQAMNNAGIDFSVIIAHPPFISNEFVLEAAREGAHGSGRFIAAVNIPKHTDRPAAVLKSLVKKGARLLKLHPAADGEAASSSRYKALLKTANDLGLPVILHTGCTQTPLLFRKPTLGRVELYAPWFKAYPKLKFILAHMNQDEPQLALDLAVEFPNLYVDTSSQPPEAIGEAARRIGAERVLFASDWPMIGNNFAVAKDRIHECVNIGLITAEQEKLILGENAAKLLNITLPARRAASELNAP
jgi:predicted TIM-barrel fold metal-dependent hydrolase